MPVAKFITQSVTHLFLYGDIIQSFRLTSAYTRNAGTFRFLSTISVAASGDARRYKPADLHGFVGGSKNVRLAGVELPSDTFNDEISNPCGMVTF